MMSIGAVCAGMKVTGGATLVVLWHQASSRVLPGKIAERTCVPGAMLLMRWATKQNG